MFTQQTVGSYCFKLVLRWGRWRGTYGRTQYYSESGWTCQREASCMSQLQGEKEARRPCQPTSLPQPLTATEQRCLPLIWKMHSEACRSLILEQPQTEEVTNSQNVSPGPVTSTICELARNPQAPLQPHQIRDLGLGPSSLCLTKPLGGLPC